MQVLKAAVIPRVEDYSRWLRLSGAETPVDPADLGAAMRDMLAARAGDREQLVERPNLA